MNFPVDGVLPAYVGDRRWMRKCCVPPRRACHRALSSPLTSS
jgi:hypothetical protein